MLIIDMPMPVKEWNCLDCKAICVDMLRHYCGITKKTIDTLRSVRARPDWCPIKGELVRCRECKHFVENTWECSRLCDRFGDEYSDARVYPDWFCADGEQKDGERRTDETEGS